MSARTAPLRRFLATVCLALFFAPLLIAGRASAAEVIQFFDSHVQVAKNGELTVTETIRVHAEGVEMKHGIYRDFPTTFKDSAGALREVTFSVLGVTRDGRQEPYFTGGAHNFELVYAGNKDALLPHGDHTYIIRYRTGRQIRWFDGKPALNWNVTGNFWHFPILAARYRLELADGQKPLRWTAYSGRLGARGTNWRGGIAGNGVLVVSTARPLAAGEGLTVLAALPNEAVDPPSQATLFYYELFDNRRWIFAGIGFVLVFGYYLAAWNAVGRDPKRGVIIPLFHPPEGVSPALANYIRGWGFGREKWRAFTAAALSLAVRGLIRLDRSGDALTLQATGKQADKDLPTGEGAILNWVAGQGGSATIDRANGKAVAKVGSSFTSSIEAESRNRFFHRNLGYVLAGVAVTAVVIFVVVNYGGLQEEDVAALFGLCFGGIFAGMFLVPIILSLFAAGGGFAGLVRRGMALITAAIFVLIVTFVTRTFFPNGFGLTLPKVTSMLSAYSFSFVLVIAFAALNGAFLFLMRAPTAYGRPIMDQLAGFRLYLETAEKDRLNMAAPEITADRFEALLPYAVALDVEKPWAQAFAAALSRANPGDADPMRNYQPAWSSGGWSSHDFGSAVSSSISSVSDAFAAAVPSSSGSGGGGSGGGGGGGGGGGW